MKYLVTLLTIFISLTTFGQDTYLQAGDADLEEIATEITDAYVNELGLRAKQELLFRKKVEEFLIREQKIKQTYKGKEMLDQMVILRKNETAEMADILTRLQLDKYKEVRPRIQPLSAVKQ